MNKNILFLSLLLVATAAFTCRGQTSVNSYTIRGHLAGLKDTYVYFKGGQGDLIHIDSTIANSGNFMFTGDADEPYYAQIYTNSHKAGFGFYVQKGQIGITGDIDLINKVKITGSPTQNDWEAFNLGMKDLYSQQSRAEKDRLQATAKNDTAAVNAVNIQTNRVYRQLIERYKAYIIAHPTSFLSVELLTFVKITLDYEELNKLFNGLDSSVQHTMAAKKFYEKFIVTMSRTAVGKPAIMFTQNDVNGKPFCLADYTGEYILLDFWASWCTPCRQENPSVVKAFNKYKNKGFTVVGVSLDDKKDDWKKAIAHDNLTWKQVSSLNGWKNEVAQQYSVNLIPANYLIAPDGTIIAHNLFGEDLEMKLNTLLK